jgi:hypothetical protein
MAKRRSKASKKTRSMLKRSKRHTVAVARATEASKQKREWALLEPTYDAALSLASAAAKKTGKTHYVKGYLGQSLATNYHVAGPHTRVSAGGSVRRHKGGG